MGFPKSVVDKALVACGRCCCICHNFCGTNIELHHIVQHADGGSDDFDNCIPLCFNCHASMGRIDPRHPKGKHYSKEELVMHRDQWYAHKAAEFHSSSSICNADKKQFEELCSIFKQAEYVLTKHDMTAAFQQDEIAALIKYSDLSADPYFSFINAGLEELRQSLLSELRICVMAFRRYLYWNEGVNHNLCASHLWLYHHDKIQCEVTPALLSEYEEEIRLLTQTAENIWAAYIAFVRQARLVM